VSTIWLLAGIAPSRVCTGPLGLATANPNVERHGCLYLVDADGAAIRSVPEGPDLADLAERY
jgi:hypothetical protein